MNDASVEERLPLPPWKQFVADVIRHIRPVVKHGIGLLTAIAFMGAAKAFYNFWFGPDATIYDLFPARFMPQTIDLIIFARFAISAWRDLR